ncbi:MAG: hypothetical protein EOP04_17705, partial [Proteobacteria bacterium]
ALEIKIAERTAELQENNKSLIKTNLELQEFNYISSHDLQEPLRKIQIFVSRIQESEKANLSGKGIEYFDKISDSAQRMQQLIDDLLAYSTTERSSKKFERVDLDALASEVLSDLSEEILESHATVRVESLGMIAAIPFQFKQLLYNLVGNALKYAGSKTAAQISITGEDVTVTGDDNLADGVYKKISVTDNGIGFEQQYSQKIFDLFQRLHGKLEYGGTGVGLAIVKKIVENHKGTIHANGVPGKGAVFTVLLPVEGAGSGLKV